MLLYLTVENVGSNLAAACQLSSVFPKTEMLHDMIIKAVTCHLRDFKPQLKVPLAEGKSQDCTVRYCTWTVTHIMLQTFAASVKLEQRLLLTDCDHVYAAIQHELLS